jgi:hypothetical protein
MEQQQVTDILLDIKEKMKSDCNSWESLDELDSKFDFVMTDDYLDMFCSLLELEN